jgi:hypothetical protein
MQADYFQATGIDADCLDWTAAGLMIAWVLLL